jgi:hypothetical protein
MSDPTRIVVAVLFLTCRGAAAGIDALRTAGYDVLVGDHIIDECSDETVFAEVYKQAGPDDDVIALAGFADTVWMDVMRIVEQFDGSADSCGLIGDDQEPFSEYRDTADWGPALVN